MHRDQREGGGGGLGHKVNFDREMAHIVWKEIRRKKKNRKKVHILFKKSIRNNIICRTIQ